MPTDRATKQVMDRYVRKLKAAGWHVRYDWPVTPQAIARGGLVRWGRVLCPLTPEAEQALDALCAGRPIPPRGRRHG
jgi:hypothetical protein